MKITPEDLDRLIHEALETMGWDGDAAELASKVRRLDRGLPVEDEFMVLSAWLGKCELIHKLDQQQLPIGSRSDYQVPDLLARYTTQTLPGPVLVEVKNKAKRSLSFRPDYLKKLRRYADLLGAPLLIAWKYHSMWTLFDAVHLKKAEVNFNITLEEAMIENLLGVLAGDAAYKIGAGAGIHLRFDKEKLIETKQEEIGYSEQWLMRVSKVEFTDRDGAAVERLSSGTQTLFTTWDLETSEEHADDHIWVRNVSTGEGIQFAHTALVRLLDWHQPQDVKLSWRQLMRKEKITTIEDFRGVLVKALDEGVVHLVLDQRPRTTPTFVTPPVKQ